MDLESTSIYQYGAPTSARLHPQESAKPILAPDYELHPCLINMVQDQPFSGKDDKKPYSHQNEFEQTCACPHIAGMSDELYKLFPFSLIGKAKRWYNLTIGSRQGDWEALWSSFCLQFFPISRVVRFRLEILSLKEKKKESLGMASKHFNALVNTSLDLVIQDPILLQHFYMGLDRKNLMLLNMALEGSFLHVSTNSERNILTIREYP
jgi:hypothetical protein